MDPANIISKLRALKDASTRNQQYINTFTMQVPSTLNYKPTSSGAFHTAFTKGRDFRGTGVPLAWDYNHIPTVPGQYYQQHPVSGSFDNFFTYPNTTASQADFNSRVLQDFQARNQDLIDAQVEREHAHQIMTNILANMADYEDAELDKRLANLNMTELQQNKTISTGRDIIKTIHLAPVTKYPASPSNCETDGEESGPDIADISEQDHEKIAEYIDTCYEHIIKVLKVYFILADGKTYRLPRPAEVRDMKTRLEGHIHVPDDVFRARELLAGTRIYYLTVDEKSNVVLKAGLVYKLGQTGIIILDELEKRKLDIGYSCPVFRKINNLDIASVLAG
jgi:hypothetical protein